MNSSFEENSESAVKVMAFVHLGVSIAWLSVALYKLIFV